MGMSEAVMLDMMGHIVVLGTALGTLMVPGYWSLQMGCKHTVYETRRQVGNICSWSGEKYS